MPDKFDGFSESLDSPPSHVFAVTPNDTADLPSVTRGLNVATSGTVQVTTTQGETAAIFVAAGITFPIRAQRVWATGTTATGIVGLF